MKNGLSRLMHVFNALRFLDDTMPIQWAALFLEVAHKEGQSITELAKRTGMTMGSTSRNASCLSDWTYQKKLGLAVVTISTDRMDLTRRQVTLSPKGRKLIDHLIAIVEG